MVWRCWQSYYTAHNLASQCGIISCCFYTGWFQHDYFRLISGWRGRTFSRHLSRPSFQPSITAFLCRCYEPRRADIYLRNRSGERTLPLICWYSFDCFLFIQTPGALAGANQTCFRFIWAGEKSNWRNRKQRQEEALQAVPSVKSAFLFAVTFKRRTKHDAMTKIYWCCCLVVLRTPVVNVVLVLRLTTYLEILRSGMYFPISRAEPKPVWRNKFVLSRLAELHSMFSFVESCGFFSK